MLAVTLVPLLRRQAARGDERQGDAAERLHRSSRDSTPSMCTVDGGMPGGIVAIRTTERTCARKKRVVASESAGSRRRGEWLRAAGGRGHGRASHSGPGQEVGSGCCGDRKSTRLNSSHLVISYAVFC